MRALIYVVCLIGAMCGWSCSDHIADSSDLSVQTRTIVSPEGVSTSNPDLISDWEHQSLLTLSTGERPCLSAFLPDLHSRWGDL